MDKVRREGLLTAMEATFNPPGPADGAGLLLRRYGGGNRPGPAGFRVGDRWPARGGYAVHAEYAVVPHNLIARVPENVDFESAAFATVGAVAMHGFRLSQVQLGRRWP